MAGSTLKEKTSKGLFWGGTSNFIQQLLNAAFGVYLARTLSPGDYGLVGMLAIFSLLASLLVDGSFSSALINRKEIKHEDYNAVFWFNIFVAVICAVLLFAFAPLIARFFHHQELVAIARWYAFGFLVSGFGPAQKAYLTKKLMIREIAISNISAVAISGSIGVYLAYRGMGYWTLVIQALILGFLTNLGYWISSGWRPSFRIDFRPVSEMLRFSIKMVITSFVNLLSNNFITVLLGRFYPADKVGYYTQASKWELMGVNVLSGMINSVTHPVLASVVDEKDRQLRVFRKIMRFAAFVSFPAMLGLAFIAPEFITIALTDKWADSVLLLRILCVGGAFNALIAVCMGLLLSRGNSGAYMWSSIFLCVALIATIFACFPYGITAMVIGITSVNVLWLVVWQALVKKEIGYTLVNLLSDILPFLGFSLISVGAAYFALRAVSNIVVLLLLKIVLTAAVYILLMLAGKSVTFKESVAFLKGAKS